MGRVLLKVPFLSRPSPAPTHPIQFNLKVIILGDSGSVQPLTPNTFLFLLLVLNKSSFPPASVRLH